MSLAPIRTSLAVMSCAGWPRPRIASLGCTQTRENSVGCRRIIASIGNVQHAGLRMMARASGDMTAIARASVLHISLEGASSATIDGYFEKNRYLISAARISNQIAGTMRAPINPKNRLKHPPPVSCLVTVQNYGRDAGKAQPA